MRPPRRVFSRRFDTRAAIRRLRATIRRRRSERHRRGLERKRAGSTTHVHHLDRLATTRADVSRRDDSRVFLKRRLSRPLAAIASTLGAFARANRQRVVHLATRGVEIRPETSFAAATTRDSKFATRRGESFVRHRDGRRARRNLRERHRRGKGHSLLRTSAFPLAFALSFAFVAVPRDDVRDERVDDGVDDDGVRIERRPGIGRRLRRRSSRRNPESRASLPRGRRRFGRTRTSSGGERAGATSLSPTVEEIVEGTVEGTVETSEMRRIRRRLSSARAARVPRRLSPPRRRVGVEHPRVVARVRRRGARRRAGLRTSRVPRSAAEATAPRTGRATGGVPERPLGAHADRLRRARVGIRPGLGRRDGGGETPRADGDANGPRIRFRIYPVRQPREVVLLLRGGDLERFGGRRRGDEATFATRPFERSQHDADRSRRRDWWYDRRRSGGEIGGERGGARDFERCRVGCRTGCLVGCRHSRRRVASASASAVASAPKLDVRFHPRDASCARRRGASAAVRRRA